MVLGPRNRTLDVFISADPRATCTDHRQGRGTYFTSAFAMFMRQRVEHIQTLREQGKYCFVIFPDKGAHRRFYECVQSGGSTPTAQAHETAMKLLPLSNILYRPKTRVGQKLEMLDVLRYVDENGDEVDYQRMLPEGSHVWLCDDFIHAGGTLIKCAQFVRDKSDGNLHVEAFVTHFVARYEQKTVRRLVDSIYSEKSVFDVFHCTDSVP